MDKQSGYLPLVKHVANAAGHQLPFGIGSLLSFISAGNRISDSDYVGAGLDTVSGLTSWMPFVGTPISLSADLINLSRDIKSTLSEKPESITELNTLNNNRRRSENIILPNEKAASAGLSNFEKDISDKDNANKSNFYRSLNSVITPSFEESLADQDKERINQLKDEVRKGLVSLDYLTGHKKNTAESFYDVAPATALGLSSLKKAPVLGLGVAGIGVLENLRRQRKNMNLTEPAKMSRTENPLDRTNPMELLNPSDKKPVRADISSIFGDFEGAIDKRLSLIDKFNSGGAESLSAQYKLLSEKEKELLASSTQKIEELRNQLKQELSQPAAAPVKGKKAPKNNFKNIENLITQHKATADHNLKLIQDAKNSILQKAKASEGNVILQKYVNLHESLRRAGGNLKGYIGEGLGPLSGITDLAEKYHITGAHPHFNQGLLADIATHHAGTQASPSQLKKFMGSAMTDLANPSFQGSGIRKFINRNKYPLIAGGVLAAAGGLYPLFKKMQEEKYSKSKINEWKKTILKARGDYDAVRALEEQEALEAQEEKNNQEQLTQV
jgi:hypothetical protein